MKESEGEGYRLVFYRKPDGEAPVESFLRGLEDRRHETKINAWLGVLRAQNLRLREPHVKPLGNALFELRVPYGRMAYRVLFFYGSERDIVLTNAFVKKQAKSPPEEIDRAKRAREMYLRYRNRYPGAGLGGEA